MNDHSWQGNLSYTPFGQILLRLWEKKNSGRLWLQNGDTENVLFFYKGDPALTGDSFPAAEFEKRLVEKAVLTGEQAEETHTHALEKNISFTRALIERQMLSPPQTWELLAEFWLDGLFPLFDWAQGDYIFDAAGEPAGQEILMTVACLEFILQGIRRMTNFGLIEASLPAESESLQILSPGYAGVLRLVSHERYLLNLLRLSSRLQEVYEKSQLGKRETQKTLFILIQIGLAGLSQPRNKLRPASEFSPGEAEKIWADFNDKCSYIYKYISKEIGPAVLNVLEKTLDEVKSRLAPPLQSLELRTDGRIELKPAPLVTLNLSNEANRKSFLRLLNEILVAEVLAVKKTLGNNHEATLVRNLERIGEQG